MEQIENKISKNLIFYLHNYIKMELWLILSGLYAILQAVMVVASKYIMKNLTPVATLTYLLFFCFIIIVICNWSIGYKMYSNKYSIVGGIALGISYLGLMIGIDKAPNAGLADALLRLQIIITTFLSVIFLKQKLTNKGIFGIVLAAVGAFMITYKKSDTKDKKSDTKDKKDVIPWYVYPLLAGIFISICDVAGVKAVQEGMSPATYVYSTCLMGFIIIFMYNYTLTHSFFPQFKDNKKKNKTILELLIAAIATTFSTYAITTAMPMAPNAGYSKAISLFSVVLSTLYSVIVFNDKINIQKTLGIIGLLIGCIFVSLAG